MSEESLPVPAPGGGNPASPSADPPYPWDEEDPPAPDAPDSPRQRHDSFTEARKCAFLKALVKTGGILDACRLAGPSPRTVYRHQESDPRFLEHCRLALKMSGAPVELTAWERAVEGVEEEIAVGGRMVKRRRYSENLLRLLLQASDPKKYGPRPGFKRKRLLRFERKQMEREIRAEVEAENALPPFEDAIESLNRALDAFGARRGIQSDEARLAAGWSMTPEGHLIPPGYGPIPGWVPPPDGGIGDGAESGEGGGPPGDSL